MIYWKCPNCKRMREYNPKQNLIVKICFSCQGKMKLIENKTLEELNGGR